MFRHILHASFVAIVVGMLMSPTARAATGKSVVQSACAACHASGVAGAPKLGSAADWGPRIDKGIAALYRSALQGTDKGMPPKGGRSDLPDADVKAAVDYMVAQAGTEPKAAAEKTAKKEKEAAKAPAARQVSGKATYEATCAACHGTGLAGAPRLGVPEDWAPRIARGAEVLHASALKGTDKGMPAKGGNADLSEVELKAAVDYMIAQAKDVKPAAGTGCIIPDSRRGAAGARIRGRGERVQPAAQAPGQTQSPTGGGRYSRSRKRRYARAAAAAPGVRRLAAQQRGEPHQLGTGARREQDRAALGSARTEGRSRS